MTILSYMRITVKELREVVQEAVKSHAPMARSSWFKEVARLLGTDETTLFDMFGMYSNHKNDAEQALKTGVSPREFVGSEPDGFLDAVRYARKTGGKG